MAVEEPATLAPDEGHSPSQSNEHPKRARQGLFTTICALVALFASAIGLFWDFLPQYRPDPLDTVGADVSIFSVEPGVRLVDWLRRTHGADFAPAAREIFGRRPSASELRQPGELLYVRTQVDGHKHRDVSLRYRLYDGASHKPVELPLPQSLAKVQRIRLEAPSQRSVQLLWTPDLREEDGAFIRVELTSEHGLLAVTDSGTLHKGWMRRR
jgi:hypothetical protein